MRKPPALRAALVAALPQLAADPDRLKIFVDKGKLHARQTERLGFEYRYELTLMLLDFVGDPDTAMLPILLWLRAEQPDLFERDEGTLAFEVDILSDAAVDLVLTIPLRESVRVRPRLSGGFSTEAMEEPRLADLDEPLAGS